nr:lasso peptide biosynthesis B2 protein [Actinomycetota bacterium]
DRVEVVAWSLASRILVTFTGPNHALRLLDRVRLRRTGGEHLAATDRDALFRLAGRCLGEAVARSEYLRVRGRPHELVLGVAGTAGDFRAHAWLEPLDPVPAGFHALHRYSR